ncbi:MAG: protein of unknown function containing DUF4168 domain [Rhodobacteraceae bacterium HLUCCO18]|nr:MAG: protein of unknown function containing DUF4168 domain [Rhodobacteraceae bacterium HLUCCO18]
MTFRKTAAAATSALALTLAAAPALVLSSGTASAQVAADEYSAADIDAFVEAFVEVNDVRTAYAQQLQETEDEAEQRVIIQDGNAAIVDAIDGVDGMDVELYTAILEAAGSDEDLSQRINRRVDDAIQG